MILIKPSFKILAMSGNYQLPYSYDKEEELIEVAGRTCYKSEDKITEDSSNVFVKGLKRSGHLAMIEHSWRIMYIRTLSLFTLYILWTLIFNRFLNVVFSWRKIYIAGNIRAFDEWEIKEKVKDRLSVATGMDERYLRYKKQWKMFSATVKFICDRGVTHELVRHRPPAFAQESTRFCNYSKEKFGGQITFIIPPWFDIPEILYDWDKVNSFEGEGMIEYWLKQLKASEDRYMYMIDAKWEPQKARSILPNSLKTEIVVTADWREWQHIFNLRALGTTGKPHPQMVEIMMPTYKEFKRLQPLAFNLD